MIPPKRVHPRFFIDKGAAARAVVADEEGDSAKLWRKFKDHAAYAQYNPFVVALAAGTLKMESLVHFLGQDLYYLQKYAEACAMAQDYVVDPEDKKSFEDKIKNTKEYAEEFQKVLSAQESCPSMAAVDYTSFLLVTAAGKVEAGKGPSGSWNPVETTKIPAFSICSITPCSRLYRFLGHEFFKAVDFDSNPYTSWINHIFYPREDESLSGTEILLDKLAKSLSDEERDSLLERLYYHGLSFEIEFFSAVRLYQGTSVPLLKQGVKSNCRYTVTFSSSVLDSSKVPAKSSMKGLPSTKANTFDEKGLKEFLKRKSKVDSSGLQSLKIDIKKATILREMDISNVDVHIVSDHWSGDEIKDAFLSSGLHIACAKSFSTSEPGGFTIFNNIGSSIQEYGMQHISVYIGHDENDLLSLIEADIGIVIGQNEALKLLGESFGVSFVSLFSGLLKKEIAYAEGYTGWNKEPGTIYTVSSWCEICAFLMGSSN